MHLYLLANLGDTMVTMHKVQSLDPHEPPETQFTYELRFLDLPTSTTEVIVCSSENDAVLMFAAWLTADEPDFDFTPFIERLYKAIRSSRKFLP